MGVPWTAPKELHRLQNLTALKTVKSGKAGRSLASHICGTLSPFIQVCAQAERWCWDEGRAYMERLRLGTFWGTQCLAGQIGDTSQLGHQCGGEWQIQEFLLAEAGPWTLHETPVSPECPLLPQPKGHLGSWQVPLCPSEPDTKQFPTHLPTAPGLFLLTSLTAFKVFSGTWCLQDEPTVPGGHVVFHFQFSF